MVDILFKNVTGKTPGATTKPLKTATKTMDATLDSVRGLLLYLNPGFYVANMVGNWLMTMMSSPLRLPRHGLVDEAGGEGGDA